MITKLYCGDCVHLILKRDKNGIVTGEFICRVLNHVRSAFQYTTECSNFFDKSVAPELLEALELMVATPYPPSKTVREAKDVLSKARGQ